MTGHQLPYVARAAMPMFLLLVAALGLLYAFPGLVTWLPGKVMG